MALSESLISPLAASPEHAFLWLTAFTYLASKLAAVRVVIEHVVRRANFTAWRLGESKWSHKLQPLNAKEPHSDPVDKLERFKPKNGRLVGNLGILIDLSVDWLQMLVVKTTRGQGLEHHVEEGAPTREGLIQWIETDDVGILSQSTAHHLPVGEELVSHALLVEVDGSEQADYLRSGVVVDEVAFGAVFD